MEILFEVSWEVCNKVGGIYTVITSKAEYVKKYFDEYYFIGPYFSGKRNLEFEEKENPKEFKEAFEILKSKKIHCHFGIWKKTKIKTFLIDFSKLMSEKNEIKKILWEKYKIDSLNSDSWFEEPVVWSYAVGIFLESICKKENKNVAHFHEWLAGAGILYLKSSKAKIAKVFTTHATVVGRAMAGKKEIFKKGNSEEEALKLNVIDKHLIEKRAALNSEVFTTVSELTAEECEKIIGIKPKVIINGLNSEFLPDMDEITEIHKRNKKMLKDLVIANFFPHYSFEIEKSLLYYISGRYELYAKGIDIYIKALGNLNRRLKKENSEKSVVAFLLIPLGVEGVSTKLLKNMMLLKKVEEKIEDSSEELKKRILFNLFSEKSQEVIDDKFVYESKKILSVFNKKGIPEITTHYLREGDDKIMKLIFEEGLENNKEDKVKIIFYPAYVSEEDGVLNTDYYNVASGFHLGVFPSFYEPWGYTPFESAALGVPTITTDLSGFGRYVIENKKDKEGIIVLKRDGKTDEEITKELEEEMYSYLNLNKIQRIKNKTIAHEFANKISWKNIVKDYAKVYQKAIKMINS